MEGQEFKKVFQHALRSKDFRQDLAKDLRGTLKKYYPDYIPCEEDEEILMELIMRDRTPWWLPSSFKEACTAVLSLFFIIIMGYIVIITARSFGANEQYEHGKELLTLLFPIFAAIVSFWTGISIEGKRADKNEEAAHTAQKEKNDIQRKHNEALIRHSKTQQGLALIKAKMEQRDKGMRAVEEKNTESGVLEDIRHILRLLEEE